MSASEKLRAAKRAKYFALQEAGINTQAIEFVSYLSQTDHRHYAGIVGTTTYTKLLITPSPKVIKTYRTTFQDTGFSPEGEIVLQGAFPQSLSGVSFTVDNAGEEISSEAFTKTYNTVAEFCIDIEQADYFLLNTQKYRLKGAGFLSIDSMESEWEARLIQY